MRYTGPKNRVARRAATDLGLKTPGSKAQARLLKRLNLIPGQHGARSRRKFSERARQLQETQKLKILYGVTAKQMKNYFEESVKKRGNTALHLVYLLEKRLDNIVYRLGFAPTRASARQLVNHGHMRVNENVVDIPSYKVKQGEVVSFTREKSSKIPYIEQILENKTILIPLWLEKKGLSGKMVKEPITEDIEKIINLQDVVEYYSR